MRGSKLTTSYPKATLYSEAKRLIGRGRTGATGATALVLWHASTGYVVPPARTKYSSNSFHHIC